MEQVADIGVELNFTAQAEQQVSLGRSRAELNARSHCQILRERFAQLTQFDQRGVGIARKYSLSRIGELEKNRIVFFEKGEVAVHCHVLSLEFVTSHPESSGAMRA